jgi:hypothetical protein
MPVSAADRWIENILKNSSPVSPAHPLEAELSDLLVETCYLHASLSPNRIGLLLASAFDLMVACQYYSALTHTGWLYCPGPDPRLFFHYTNCCPRDVLKSRFHFHPSNKPESGVIGAATSRLLLLFMKSLFKHNKRTARILRGTEPVDAIVVDDKAKRVLFAEIKASPLLTPAVAMKSQRLTEESDGSSKNRGHSPCDNTSLFNSDLDLHIPLGGPQGAWSDSFYRLGRRADAKDREWGHRGLLALLRTNTGFFKQYFAFWSAALKTYHPKRPTGVFWLTNACGAPTPVPDDWPERRRGSGYETVSDTKSSVGMDRTDDIKKGTYQVLKLGAEGKPGATAWGYRVGLISNIHAARHFDEYLDSLKDIVWTIDVSGKAKLISDLSADQPLYNLFDGIIALTQTLSRDEWIRNLFAF